MRNKSSKRAVQIIVSKLIKPVMKDKGISAYRLSKETGMSQSAISRFLKDGSDIQLSNFLAILGTLDIKHYKKLKLYHKEEL